jgi:predicted TIM-barrel fold metal-dependent hydrolase
MSMVRLPAIDDPEGDRIPDGLPFVVDAHVHIFPDRIFKALWTWFDQFAWPIRYRFDARGVLNYLLQRGVGHVAAFQYAHKPGMADLLNDYMAGLCREYSGRVTGMATVFPGEPDSEGILRRAFAQGLKGVKLHAHVQCFDMNSADMDIIYDLCSSENTPLVMHVSREPKSPAYKCDPYVLCSAEKLKRVLQNFPGLKICVPHLGVDEFLSYKQLIETFDTLWLDTAMAVTDYFPMKNPFKLSEMRIDRILYGTDFPNIPYAWDREIKILQETGLSDEDLALVLGKNAMAFFNLEIRAK